MPGERRPKNVVIIETPPPNFWKAVTVDSEMSGTISNRFWQVQTTAFALLNASREVRGKTRAVLRVGSYTEDLGHRELRSRWCWPMVNPSKVGKPA